MSTHIQQSGYQSKSRLSPAAIGGVLLVHAGLGAVILTMSAVSVITLPDPVIWAWNIPKDKPKPVVEPKRDTPEVRTATQAATTTTELPLPSFTDREISLTPFDITPIGGTSGSPLIEPVLPPVTQPQPVIVQPRADARYASAFQPPYPAAMLRQQMEGSVTVRVTIGPDGRVIDVALVSAADPAFFEATRRQALSRWRFVPGTRDGVAITTEKVMTVHFHLTD